MHIPELRIPGSFLKIDLPAGETLGTYSLLTYMASLVGDAALSLSWYQDARDADLRAWPNRDEWEQDAARRMQLQTEYRTFLPAFVIPEEYREKYQRYSEEVDRLADREKWERGELPLEYTSRAPVIHARSFVYALDGIAKAIGALARLPTTPGTVAEIRKEWDKAFPYLKAVRNTAHHMEDRLQGKAYEKSIPTNFQFYDSFLQPDRYGGTLADGRYGEVSVTPASLEKAKDIVQDVLDAFEWTGPARLLPR